MISEETAAGTRDRRLWLALATIYVAWGSTYLAIRVMVETVPPLLGAGVRFLTAAALLVAALVALGGRKRLHVDGREALAAAAAGTLILGGGIGLVTVAEQEVPSGLAALIIASVPLWVVLLRLLANERIPRATLAGVVGGFAGVAILVLPGVFDAKRENDASLSLTGATRLARAYSCPVSRWSWTVAEAIS